MDAGTAVELPHLGTHAIWPLGCNVWLPSTFVKEEAYNECIDEFGTADGHFLIFGVKAKEEEEGHDQGGFRRSTDNYESILGHTEEEAVYREGSYSDAESGLPESQENHGSILIKVEGNTTESDVARCSPTEQLQSPMIQVSFGGDHGMMTCEKEEPLEHSFDIGNHSLLFHPWADKDQHSSQFGDILKGIKKEPRDEDEPVIEVEGSTAGNRENGRSYAVVNVNVEEDKQVCDRDQLMMHVKEEPADNPHPSSDDSIDLLADEGGSNSGTLIERAASGGPGAFPLVSSSPDAQTGCPDWVLLSYHELAEAVTQQVDEWLDKDVKALLLPLKAKCSDLREALRQNRHHIIQLGKQLSDLLSKEQRKKNQAQGLLTRAKDTPEEDAHISAPVSKLGTPHSPGRGNKHRCRHPGTSRRRQLRKAEGKCLQENLTAQHAGNAVTTHQQSQLDSHEAAEDRYQHDRLEVRRVAVAEHRQSRTKVHRPAVTRPRRKQTFEVLQPRCGQDSLENWIPCEVELQPGIPYNPDSFWDAPYSIWMD